MQNSKILTLALAVALVSSTASAQTAAPVPTQRVENPEVVNMDLSTSTTIRAALSMTFDEGQIETIMALGHQKAISTMCAGFPIDEQRFTNELHIIYDGRDGRPLALTAAEQAQLDQKALLGIGMAYGAQLAIASHDEARYCAAARAERASGKVTHLVWSR